MAILFCKLLKKTDIEKRLSVPTKSLQSLPSFGVVCRGLDLEAVDGNGRVWRFRCMVRKKQHPKPVLSKGWLAFVRANKLRIGDKVTFFYEEKNNDNQATGTTGAQYMIHVEKEVRVFGAVFGYAAPTRRLEPPKFYKFL